MTSAVYQCDSCAKYLISKLIAEDVIESAGPLFMLVRLTDEQFNILKQTNIQFIKKDVAIVEESVILPPPSPEQE